MDPVATGSHGNICYGFSWRKSRLLSVGQVISNDTQKQSVLLHAYRARWKGTRLAHLPIYSQSLSDGGETEEVNGNPVLAQVPYSALASQVELYTGGDMFHGNMRRLEKGGCVI